MKTNSRKKIAPPTTETLAPPTETGVDGRMATEVQHAGTNAILTDRQVHKVKVTDLNDAPINKKLFKESLTPSGLQALIDDITVRGGLRQPIEVRRNGNLVLDGHRRLAAHKALGLDTIDVVYIEGVDDDLAVQNYVVQAFSTVRDASLLERVNVFNMAHDLLKQQHSRKPGRPAKDAPIQPGLREPKDIKAEAAKKAGFSSISMVESVIRVLKEGSKELKAKMLSGEVTVSAAVAKLPPVRQSPKSKKAKQNAPGTHGASAAGAAPADETIQGQIQAEPLEGPIGVVDTPPIPADDPVPQPSVTLLAPSVRVEDADPRELAADLRTCIESSFHLLNIIHVKEPDLAMVLVAEFQTMLSQVGVTNKD